MTFYVLLKFGEPDHMESLLREGVLYMQPIDAYRKMDDTERGDPLEGMISLESFEGGRMTFREAKTGRHLEAELKWSQIRETDTPTSHLNAYCLYLLKFDVDEEAASEESMTFEVLNRFGSKAVLIYDVPEFLHRVKQAADTEGLKTRYKPVEYIQTRSHNGEVGPFRKDAKFSHQNEFRIVVEDPHRSGDVLVLKVGSLEDVATVLEASVKNQIALTAVDD